MHPLLPGEGRGLVGLLQQGSPHPQEPRGLQEGAGGFSQTPVCSLGFQGGVKAVGGGVAGAGLGWIFSRGEDSVVKQHLHNCYLGDRSIGASGH